MQPWVSIERLLPFATFAAAALHLAGAAADEVVVMTSGAFTAPFEHAAPWFERRSGHDVVSVFGASTGGAVARWTARASASSIETSPALWSNTR